MTTSRDTRISVDDLNSHVKLWASPDEFYPTATRDLCSAIQTPWKYTQSLVQIFSQWHIDGHHSLICWRFIAALMMMNYCFLILWYSQIIPKCHRGVCVSSRVRSDKGGENLLVCQFMVSYHGTGRGSHLAGSSIHNQRIERHVYRCICSTYHKLFYSMEDDA